MKLVGCEAERSWTWKSSPGRPQIGCGNKRAGLSCLKVRKATMVMIRDVTERKQAERRLETIGANFRNSMDSSAIGIRISDNKDCTSYVNKAFLGYLWIQGHRRSQVMSSARALFSGSSCRLAFTAWETAARWTDAQTGGYCQSSMKTALSDILMFDEGSIMERQTAESDSL